MKEFVKSAYFKTIKLIETFISLVSILLFSSFVVAKNFKKKIRNKEKSDECFVLGNGFSLKKVFDEDPNVFTDKDIYTVNLFYETDIFNVIKPKNHIIADSGFWNITDDIRILGIQEGFIKNFLNVTWNINLFIPYEGVSLFEEKLKSNQRINIIAYNHIPVSGYKLISHYLYKKNLGMPKPTNVLNAALFIALNVGYRRLNLYGADHSWISDLFVDEDNNVCCYENHFYDNIRKSTKMPKDSLTIGLRSIVEAFESYKLLDIYAKSIGSSIINKTKGSFIDVFDKE